MEVSRVAHPVSVASLHAPGGNRPLSPLRRGSPLPMARCSVGRSPSPLARSTSQPRHPSRVRSASPAPLRPPTPAVITGTFMEYKGSRYGDHIVTYVAHDPPPVPRPIAAADTTSQSSQVARLTAEISRLEAENRRLEDQAHEDALLRSKYTHSLHDLSQEHAALFDRLARNRDNDFLLLLDHYEDAVAQLHRLQLRFTDHEVIQRRLLWANKQLQAAQEEAAEMKAKLKSVAAEPRGSLDLHNNEQVWVCLSVQAGKLLLQPDIPESAISSSSAAKVAQYTNSPYQQAMRQTHLQSNDLRHRVDDQAQEIVGLKKQVARLQRQLQLRPIPAPPPPPPPPPLGPLHGELPASDVWPQPQESPKPQEQGRSHSRGRRPPHVNPKAVQRVWVDSLRSPPVTPQLYCFSEYGRILRDNEPLQE